VIVTQHPRTWRARLDAAVPDRIGAAPPELIDELVAYVAMVNALTGNPAVTAAATAPPDLLDDVRGAIADMPESVTAMLPGVLLGVYFAHALGSSAITDIVTDEQGVTIGTVVALDIDALLTRRANAWATWKESSPFRLSGSISLDVRIADAPDDTRAGAIQFLLLHEFGHVLTAGTGFLPDWWRMPDGVRAADDYSFLPLAWDIHADNRILPRHGEDFAGRERVRYYGAAQLDGDELLPVYTSLQQSSFPTLYASTNAYDDFAESFATYVHCVLLGRPWQARVLRDGAVQHVTDDFWSSPRGAPKRAFMERLLAQA